MIAFRLLSIASRKYAAQPDEREAAARVMALNALRLAVHHLGRREAAKLAMEAVQEPELHVVGGRACS